MSLPFSNTILPERDEFAHSFFTEAVRHLTDARILAVNHRAPASITSSMKAAELAIKAILILNNFMGVHSNVFTTHNPFTAFENVSDFKPIRDAVIDRLGPQFVDDLKEMEKLTPSPFSTQGGASSGSPTSGAGSAVPTPGANTEYPYLERRQLSGSIRVVLRTPESYFDDAQARRYYNRARSVINTLMALYPVLGTWAPDIPGAL